MRATSFFQFLSLLVVINAAIIEGASAGGPHADKALNDYSKRDHETSNLNGPHSRRNEQLRPLFIRKAGGGSGSGASGGHGGGGGGSSSNRKSCSGGSSNSTSSPTGGRTNSTASSTTKCVAGASATSSAKPSASTRPTSAAVTDYGHTVWGPAFMAMFCAALAFLTS